MIAPVYQQKSPPIARQRKGGAHTEKQSGEACLNLSKTFTKTFRSIKAIFANADLPERGTA